MADNNSSGTNTVLIVLVLIVLVGFVVWWFAGRGDASPTLEDDAAGLNVDVNLPNGDGGDTGGPNY